MIKYNDNVYISTDDNEVLAFIDNAKKYGAKIPEIDTTKTFVIPMVKYDKGFVLYLVMHFSLKGDAGFTLFRADNFMTAGNGVNLLEYEKYGFKASDIVSTILIQVTTIAEKINYPFHISVAIKPDFIGLIATPHHPIDEIYNLKGHNN